MDPLESALCEIRNTKARLEGLESLLKACQDVLKTKDTKIRDLKSENKALKVAYQTLADKRREDIATLHAWQQQIAEPPTEAISSSQPAPPISSDPPSYQASQPLLPQRTLKRNRDDQSIDQVTLSELIHMPWHPSDFLMATDPPETVEYTNPGPQASRRLHERGCENCATFISILSSPVEQLHRPETLPGFWRSEFASTQEREEESRAQHHVLLKECMFRLLEAMNMGRFRFSNSNLQQAINEGAIDWDN